MRAASLTHARRARLALAALAALALATAPACNLDDTSGGRAHLPTTGLGPFGKPPLDVDTPTEEPFVLVERQFALTGPSAIADGDGFYLLYARAPASSPDGPREIWGVHLTSLTAAPTAPPARVLAATEGWEAGRVGAPSLTVAADGTWLLFYEGGPIDAPAVGLARSTDRGATWEKAGVVLAGGREPVALALDDGRVLLYTARADGRAIELAVADAPGGAFVAQGPVLEPQPARDAFDHAGVDAPAVAGGTTVAGQLRVNLYVTGIGSDGRRAIGSAASADGVTFVRFFGGEPVVLPTEGDESEPSVMRFADRAVMFFVQPRSNTPAIAVATAP